MSISIKVRYSRQEKVDAVQAYILKVEVLEATDVTKKIFVFQRRVKSVMDAEVNALGDMFVSIASPVSIEEFPEDISDPANDIPYYRLASVTLLFRSMIELEETRLLIDADITKLVQSLKATNTIIPQEDVVYA